MGWQFITDLGDSALTIPLAVLAALCQIALGQYRLTRSWILAVCASGAIIAVLKIVFGACGSRVGTFGMTSPSGHVALSTTVYLGLALWLGRAPDPGWRRVFFSTAGVALILAIALSRIVLHRHVWPEVLTGLVVGFLAAAWFGYSLRRDPPAVVPLARFLVPALVVIAFLHGTRWMLEPTIHQLAYAFKFGWCS